jgi:anti-sigma-K factor RskA
MKEPVKNDFIELSWRQRLTDAERASLQEYLAAHPEAKADCEAESQLSRLLEKLPEAPPVASNFTARVMQAVERETEVQTRERNTGGWRWVSLRVWLARTVTACVVVGAVFFGLYEHQLGERRMMAQNVAKLAEAYSAASPVSTEDFDPISRLGSEAPAKPDTDLIALMQ